MKSLLFNSFEKVYPYKYLDTQIKIKILQSLTLVLVYSFYYTVRSGSHCALRLWCIVITHARLMN